MIYTIPVQPIPSQDFQVVLGTQNVSILIYILNDGILYCNVAVNGEMVSSGRAIRVGIPLCYGSANFQGKLYFKDVLNLNVDPEYKGLGSRWVLVWDDNKV